MNTRYIQYGVAFVGIVYIAFAVLGFLPIESVNPMRHPESDTRYLLKHIAVNPLHDLVHLAIGVSGVIAATSLERARLWGKFWGVALLALFAIGMLQAIAEGYPADQLLLGLVPLNSPGHMLHFVTGALALYLGFARPIGSSVPAQT